jgi:pyruvate formate lyase activating enzyme
MTISLSLKKDDYVECRLCPNRCQLKEDEIGKCSVRVCDGDTISLSNYGEFASVAINPIEKKPLVKYMPGTNTLSIGGVGCSLNCRFCENHIISQCERDVHLKKFSVNQLICLAKGKYCDSICMTFNEPTISFEFLIDLADACKTHDLKFILKTNAYVNQEPWAEICKVTDAMNIDWKGCGESYLHMTGATECITMARIEEAYEAGVHIEISIPFYYSSERELQGLSDFVHFLKSIDRNIPCHLVIIRPSFKVSEHICKCDSAWLEAKHILESNMSNIFME